MKRQPADQKTWFERLLYDVRLRPKLTFFFLVFAIFPLLFSGILTFSVSARYMRQSEYTRLQQEMEQKINTVDYFLTAYTAKCEMLSNNSELQELLFTPKNTVYDQALCSYSVKRIVSQATEEISYLFQPFSDYYAGKLRVQLYTSEASLPLDNVLLFPMELYTGQRESSASPSLYRWYGPIEDENGACIALDRDLYYYTEGQKIGVVRLLIPLERLESILNGNDAFHYATCVANADFTAAVWGDNELFSQLQGRLQKGSIGEGVQTVRVENKRQIVGVFTSPVCGWKMICSLPYDVVNAGTRPILFITFLALLTALFFAGCFLWVISLVITRRMSVLSQKTADVRDGNLHITDVIDGNDEIGQIDRDFNEMVYRLNELIEKEYKAKLRSNQAAMELLQEQINPHLLYNSLSMIAYRAKEQHVEGIGTIVESMIAFYHNALNQGSMITTLGRELEMVKDYLALVSFVYDLEIESVVDVDSSLIDSWCIKMLLQPIVENAVVHGLRPHGGGLLCITGELRDGNVVLEIMNDGKTLSAEELTMLEKVCAGQDIPTGGYALKNIVLRLRLFFGERFTMKYKAMIEGGTCVEIAFPNYTRDEMENITDMRGDLS